MAKFNPADFIRKVRQELNKVTWPTRKETMLTTGMVLMMSVFMALFFFLGDQAIAFAIEKILRLGVM